MLLISAESVVSVIALPSLNFVFYTSLGLVNVTKFDIYIYIYIHIYIYIYTYIHTHTHTYIYECAVLPHIVLVT